jgi:hypothetical protein
MNGNLAKNLLMHIKYPYTAVIISIMWIGMALIIGIQNNPDVELLVLLTAASSLIVAGMGFSSPKK